MANTIRIDTRLLQVNWTTATTYRLELGSGLVREVGNNRSFSAAQSNAKTFTTFDSGPTISAVTPAVGTTNSFETTATITFNRTIYENPIPNEILLYKFNQSGTDELIAVLTTESSRVIRAENTVTIDLKNLVDSSSTYYFDSFQPIYTDMFNFSNERLDFNKFRYSTGRPNIDFVSPPVGFTNAFVTTATISYDRNIKKRSGNFYLYKQSPSGNELLTTISTSSTRVVVENDTVKIDLKDLIDGAQTYFLTSDYGALDDLATNFRAESVSEEKFKYSTGRPLIDQVTPALNTTGSFATTAVISYDRNVKKRTGNFYLYKEQPGEDSQFETFLPNDPRVTIDGDDVIIDLRYLLNGNSTYYLRSEYDTIDDLETNFRAEPVNEEIFRYSTGPGPIPVTVTPTYGSTGTFVSTATITFDKNVTLHDGNVYLYSDGFKYRTIPATSSSLRVVNGNKVEITLYNEPIPEDDYYIGFDLGTIIDANTFSAEEVTTDSLVKWQSISLANSVDNLSYNSRAPYKLFQDNAPVIIDEDPNPAKAYTFVLTANSGTFLSEYGITSGNTLTWIASKAEINSNIADVEFDADVNDMNWDLNYFINISKDGVPIAFRARTMIGIPYDLDQLVLTSNTLTNSVGAPTVLTLHANTNSNVFSGLITYKNGDTVLGTGTFVNNYSSLTIPRNTLSLGTSTIVAEWNGQVIPPKFNSKTSNLIDQRILPKSLVTATMTLNPIEFYYHNLNGTTASNVAASILLRNQYRTHEPSGTITIYDGATVLGTGSLTQGSNSSTVTINWNPLLFGQIDTGSKTISASYDGDDWNNTSTTATSFIARTRRIPTLSLNSSANITGRYSFTLTASINSSGYHDGQFVTFYYDGSILGTGLINGDSASIVVSPFSLPFPLEYTQGDHNFTAQVSQTFAYTAATSNTATVTFAEVMTPILDINAITTNPFRRYNMTRVENVFVYSTLTMTSSEVAPDGVFTGTITLSDGVTLTATTFSSTGSNIGKQFVFWNPTEKGQNDAGARTIFAQYSGDNYHFPVTADEPFQAYQRAVLNTSSFTATNVGTLTEFTLNLGTVDPRKNINNYVDIYHRPTDSDRTNGYSYVYIDSVFPYPGGLPDQARLDVFINEEFVEFGTEITPGNYLQLDQNNNRVRVPLTTSTQVIQVRFESIGSYALDKSSYPDGTIKFYDGEISTATLLATTTASVVGYYEPNNRPHGVITATVALSSGSHSIIAVLEGDTYFENYTTPAFTVIR